MNNHDTAPRRRLTDILNGGVDSLRAAWGRTEAALDFTALPTGVYTARAIGGELFTARSGTPGYKLTFRVLDGEHSGRCFWHEVWLTPAALPMAKRDLGKLGITAVEQLESPLPPGIRCECKVVLRRDDDGTEYNRLRGFEAVGIDADPTADEDFAPAGDVQEPALGGNGSPTGSAAGPEGGVSDGQ